MEALSTGDRVLVHGRYPGIVKKAFDRDGEIRYQVRFRVPMESGYNTGYFGRGELSPY